MTETKYYQQDTDLWRELIDQEKTYLLTRQNFLNSPSRAELIRLVHCGVNTPIIFNGFKWQFFKAPNGGFISAILY
ncbi:MAG: hypothetical protein PUP91_24415 [Rhizonema sp. PD37]|nr:hypothetical protein [Rhizonema sp. PD37]